MSPAELALVGVVVLWAVAGRRHDRIGDLLAVLAAVGAVAVVAGDRWRWQLVPLVAAAVVVAVVQVVRRRRGGDRAAPGVLVAVAAVASGLAAWVLPVPSLGVPDGPAVGTVAFDLVDEDRRSPSATVAADAPRRITVQAWWPAAEAVGERLALTDDGPALAAAAGDFLGLPPLALGHLDTIRTGAWVGAGPAPAEPLPVVLSLHGWGGFRFAQAPLLEQLAADGHLVLAIDHTHGAVAAQPVAGGVVPIDEQLLPDDAPPAEYDAASTVLEDTFRGDAATLVAALRRGESAVPQEVLVLADLDRIVVMGHSTGGGAALWWCTQDPGCDGVLTWDPWVEPVPAPVRAVPPTVPWLTVLSEDWVGDDNDELLRPMTAAAPDAAVVAIAGTEHRDVTVQPLLSPLAPLLGLAGELDKQRVDEVALWLSRDFLAATLGGPAPTGPRPGEVLVDP